MKYANDRLAFLLKQEVITPLAYDITLQIIQQLQINTPSRHEAAEMMLTHLAMVVTRIEQNEALPLPAPGIEEEVKSSPYYSQAKEMFEAIQANLPYVLPTQEHGFIMAHLANYLAQVDTKEG
ncbi:PRD domain-containing protein [Seinonella peptonophila]|uniref:PRD domain-containing protein n=1 Tax=Seinonella peptonophila TaxID=112248 RepID=A0A1M4Z9D3_9BACL|nr:PRD domain-containing protein [Seinonella peptonophila]SHF14548.1 PRD domain-containing protein [Seinonella peptonophila]